METHGLSASRSLASGLSLALHAGVLLVVLYFLHRDLPAFDLAVSDHFFHALGPDRDPHEGWLIPKNFNRPTFWLHTLPIRLFIAAAILTLFLLALSFARDVSVTRRWLLLTLFLSQVMVPSTVAMLKQETFRYCPSQLSRYGGPVPMINVEGARLPHLPRPTCWPAAHPAAGFSLLALMFFPRLRFAGPVIALALGGALGYVQLARGEHFITHILASLLIALFIQHLLYFLLSPHWRPPT